MSTTPTSAIVDVIEQHESTLLIEWLREQERAATRRASLISIEDLETESRALLGLLRETLRTARHDELDAPEWDQVREYLRRLSRSRAELGFSPSETATFIFSLKQPLFALLSDELVDRLHIERCLHVESPSASS